VGGHPKPTALPLGGLIPRGGLDQWATSSAASGRFSRPWCSRFAYDGLPASATSSRALIIARAVQGAGAAIPRAGSLAIISATFDRSGCGRAIGHGVGILVQSQPRSGPSPAAGYEHVSLARHLLSSTSRSPRSSSSCRSGSWRESRDHTRTRGVDLDRKPRLRSLALGAMVFGFLEWSRPEANQSNRLHLDCGRHGGARRLVLVERRAASPMLPLALFRSRMLTLANLLTLFL